MDQRNDDTTIGATSVLFRRIPPWHVLFDENMRRWRPKSAAFEDSPGGSPMSVLLEEIVSEMGRVPADLVVAFDDYSLVSFPAQLARDCGQALVRDPLPDESAHALVIGKKTKSVKRRLAKQCDWAVPPCRMSSGSDR